MQVCGSTSALRGTSLQQPARSQPLSAAPRRAVQVQALFGKRSSTAVVEEAPAAPAPRRGLFGSRSEAKPAKQQKRSSSTQVVDKAAEYEKRQSAFGRVVSAFDFAEVRSKSDAELLYDAKYGKRSADGKMTAEQAAALRRRVVGTKADYWKDWVDVKGEYAEKGYVAKDGSSTAASVPALPFLVAVVGGLFVATAFVVTQTS